MTDKISISIKNYLDSNNIEKINEILLPIHNKIKKTYSYIFEDESEFTDYFSKNYLNIVKDYFLADTKSKFNSYYNRIITYKLNDIVRKMIEEDNLDIILNRFIKKKIIKKDNMTFNEYVLELEKIELFFLKLDIIPNIDEVIRILINNKKINTIINAIFLNKNIENQVEYNQIVNISESNYVLAILEEYCKKYNIEIINNNTNIITNKNKDESNYVYDHKSLDPVGMYLKEIGMVNLLSPLKEFKLLKEYAETKDELIEKRIIEANLRLVVNIVRRKYKTLDIDFLDLIQYGNLGLYQAVKKYDIKSGYKFSTYATNWIEQSIRRYTTNECDSIRVPAQVKEMYIKYNLVKSSLEKDLGREASVVEMAEALGWTTKAVTKLLENYPQVSSLNMVISDDSDANELEYYIPNSEIVEDNVIDNIVKKELREKIETILSRVVSEKNKEIFLYRNGFITGRYETLEATGEKYNLSRERVRQIESKVFWKLRHSADGKNLAYYLDNSEQALKTVEESRKSNVPTNSKKLSYKKEKKIVSNKETNSVEEPKQTTLTSVYDNQESTENIHVYTSQSVMTPIKNYQSNVMTESQKKRFLESSLSAKSRQEEVVDKDSTETSRPKKERSYSNKGQNLNSKNDTKKADMRVSRKYNDVEKDILKQIIINLPLDYQELILKKERDELTSEENEFYHKSVITEIDNEIKRQVELGNLNESVLVNCNIKVIPEQNTPSSTTSRILFSKVPEDIMDKLIEGLSEDQRKLISKKETGSLTQKEHGKYRNICKILKRKIAREVHAGRLPSEILEEYNIKEYEPQKITTPKTLFSKVPEDIMDNIIEGLSEEERKLISKKETDSLTKKEHNKLRNIYKKIKRRIAREVHAGRLPSEILEEYNIKKYQPHKKTSFETLFSKVPEDIMNNLIKQLSEEERQIISKRENNSLTQEEHNKFQNAIKKLKVRIAQEVYYGRLSSEILKEYNIEEHKPRKQSLKTLFNKVPEDIMDKLIEELSEEEKKIISKRENSQLTKEENGKFQNSIKKLKVKIDREVYYGTLPPEILEEYNIESRHKRQTPKIIFSKVPEDIMDKLIEELSDEEKKVINKIRQPLIKKEYNIYTNSIKKLKRKIAREVHAGRLSSEILEEYNIEEHKSRKQSLKTLFNKVPEDIMDSLIEELSDEEKSLMSKRENSSYTNIIKRIKRRLAKEVYNKTLPPEILEEYNIKEYKPRKQSLKTLFNKVPEDIMDKLIEELSDEEKSLMSKRENGTLTQKEHSIYNNSVEKVKRRLAKEVYNKTLPPEILEEYNIKEYKPRKQSLKTLFNKVPEDIMDKLIEELSDEEKSLMSKRENGILTQQENATYANIIKKVKRKIAHKVKEGLLQEDILTEYDIKPLRRKVQKNKENITNYQELSINNLMSSLNQDNQEIPLDILNQRLLYLVKNKKEAKLNDFELVFKEMFDESLLTDELNPKMYSYIGLRFGYLDGKTYSNKAIERVLSSDDIKHCQENIKIYLKYELENYKKIKDESRIYQKSMQKK